jgi:hypothetical protein
MAVTGGGKDQDVLHGRSRWMLAKLISTKFVNVIKKNP